MLKGHQILQNPNFISKLLTYFQRISISNTQIITYGEKMAKTSEIISLLARKKYFKSYALLQIEAFAYADCKVTIIAHS